MSDDSELSQEQQRVRRLLAQARVDEPMPDDVVERLDRVLARLADEEGDHPAKVVELATRRRRKAATLLVAAAAVVAVGIGAGNVFPGSIVSSDGDSGAASMPESANDTHDGLIATEDGPAASAPDELSASSYGGRNRIRPDHFAADVARLNAVRLAADGADAEQTSPEGAQQESDPLRSDFLCDPAPFGPGRLVAVRYAGAPAVLAFRPPAGETQVVDLLECGTAARLRSVTLPAP